MSQHVTSTFCILCGPHDDESSDQHIKMSKHVFNFHAYEFARYRKKFLNYDQVSIDFRCLSNVNSSNYIYREKTGTFFVKLTPNEFKKVDNHLVFEYSIVNKSAISSFIVDKHFLVPSDNFSFINDTNNVTNIQPSGNYSFKIGFSNGKLQIGSFKMPILVRFFQGEECLQKIYRQLKIKITEDFERENVVFGSPFENQDWGQYTITYPIGRKVPHVFEYEIPKEYERIFMYALKPFNSETVQEVINRREIKDVIKRGPTQDNYVLYFDYLLWLDEASTIVALKHYNMSNVRVNLIRQKIVELEVPGLAEKRPSVLRGDLINIRLRNERMAYQGVITSVQDTSVLIENFHTEFLSILEMNPDVELDVKFTLTRLQYERMHKGVHSCDFKYVFPQRPVNRITNKFAIHPNSLVNKTIESNVMQMTAVKNIVNNVSGCAPYIIFGPPGTGKTITVVEAIMQLLKFHPKKRILVCAPANFACDMLCERLSKYCDKNELLRLHTCTREVSDIQRDVKVFSNLDGEDLITYNVKELLKYRIVVATLHLIGRYLGWGYSPDIVFIDEAAQATEPESDIAMALLSSGKQVILAGDPKQLGPVVAQISQNTGLAKPFMERLMEENHLYQPIRKRPLEYNSEFITMLVQNYRCHSEIIEIPNALFYENSLQCCAQRDSLSGRFVSALVFEDFDLYKRKATSVEFCGLLSKEEKNGCSPSYYNSSEIHMVLLYVKCLLNMTDIKVQESDIGIIAPYIRQVHKLKRRLEKENFGDIQVGTTEAFQGQEKRVIIISTVRAQDNLLLYDRKFNLGFVRNEKRFNVALTRAMAKLIIIGNPYVLAYDEKCWGTYIEHCQDLQAYFGTPHIPRSEQYRDKIIKLKLI